jgi:hypothetical protein
MLLKFLVFALYASPLSVSYEVMYWMGDGKMLIREKCWRKRSLCILEYHSNIHLQNLTRTTIKLIISSSIISRGNWLKITEVSEIICPHLQGLMWCDQTLIPWHVGNL